MPLRDLGQAARVIEGHVSACKRRGIPIQGCELSTLKRTVSHIEAAKRADRRLQERPGFIRRCKAGLMTGKALKSAEIYYERYIKAR